MKNKRDVLSKLLFAGIASTVASSAFARAPTEMPEPSLISLIGVGVVAGIVAYRINRKK